MHKLCLLFIYLIKKYLCFLRCSELTDNEHQVYGNGQVSGWLHIQDHPLTIWKTSFWGLGWCEKLLVLYGV